MRHSETALVSLIILGYAALAFKLWAMLAQRILRYARETP